MRMTRHNGRTGKDGVFSVKHNDRQFDLSNADHINAERAANNVYWDIRNGIRVGANPDQESELIESFDEIEKNFYEENYRDYAEAQNARNAQAYHPERNRTPEEIRHHKRTCPEETIYQIGTKDDHVEPHVLLEVVTEFTDKLTEKYGSHMHILDWALHIDESTPHVHERHVFDAENAFGELVPQQDKALQALGFELPDPGKKKGRYNNRKISFDTACRDLLFEVAKEHGLHLEEEPVYGGRKHVEKQEYIISQQRKTIASQEVEVERNDSNIANQTEKLNDLTMRVGDVEMLISEVSEVAYDTAVEVVTEAACAETQKEDILEIERLHDWLSEPERKASQEAREYATRCLDFAVSQIKKAATRIFQTVKQSLLDPIQKRVSIKKIEDRTAESVMQKLGEYQQITGREKEHPFIENERTL